MGKISKNGAAVGIVGFFLWALIPWPLVAVARSISKANRSLAITPETKARLAEERRARQQSADDKANAFLNSIYSRIREKPAEKCKGPELSAAWAEGVRAAAAKETIFKGNLPIIAAQLQKDLISARSFHGLSFIRGSGSQGTTDEATTVNPPVNRPPNPPVESPTDESLAEESSNPNDEVFRADWATQKAAKNKIACISYDNSSLLFSCCEAAYKVVAKSIKREFDSLVDTCSKGHDLSSAEIFESNAFKSYAFGVNAAANYCSRLILQRLAPPTVNPLDQFRVAECISTSLSDVLGDAYREDDFRNANQFGIGTKFLLENLGTDSSPLDENHSLYFKSNPMKFSYIGRGRCTKVPQELVIEHWDDPLAIATFAGFNETRGACLRVGVSISAPPTVGGNGQKSTTQDAKGNPKPEKVGMESGPAK